MDHYFRPTCAHALLAKAIVATTLAVANGCSGASDMTQSSPDELGKQASGDEPAKFTEAPKIAQNPINEAEAIAIAEKEYVKSGGKSKIVLTIVERAKSGILIRFDEVPASLGGHGEIRVGYDGSVLDIHMGR